MLEELANDYASYLKLDVSSGFKSVQDVIDNMLTRLEELTSVLLMIKLKNGDCNKVVSDDIYKYRSEVSVLSKKILAINDVIIKLQNNVDIIEKQVEKAEIDFGISKDNKLLSFFKPFLKKSKESVSNPDITITPPIKLQLQSVMENFDCNPPCS
ncbi:uncharacterized protein LOC113520376 [Galleria mellonella]|uniref:Uncharacterized protein LOC113520376 n=1 Tax=Galleria mellonella TaxID=7137 RepID=A0A6J1WYM4_GALME|nr:uncharacterized protein LOC113520376 [Galleria mellonella]